MTFSAHENALCAYGRDYLQDLEGHLATKADTFNVEQLAMFRELCKKNTAHDFFDGAAMEDVAEMAERALEASFQETLTRLKVDQRLFFQYIADKSKAESNDHVALVLHLEAQEARGNQFAVNWMDKHCLMLNGEPGKAATDTFVRRACRTYSGKLNKEVLTSDVYSIIWCDWTKLGRLKQTDVNEHCDRIKTVIQNNPTRSCSFMVAPLLVSENVMGGLRGECRPGTPISKGANTTRPLPERALE